MPAWVVVLPKVRIFVDLFLAFRSAFISLHVLDSGIQGLLTWVIHADPLPRPIGVIQLKAIHTPPKAFLVFREMAIYVSPHKLVLLNKKRENFSKFFHRRILNRNRSFESRRPLLNSSKRIILGCGWRGWSALSRSLCTNSIRHSYERVREFSVEFRKVPQTSLYRHVYDKVVRRRGSHWSASP